MRASSRIASPVKITVPGPEQCRLGQRSGLAIERGQRRQSSCRGHFKDRPQVRRPSSAGRAIKIAIRSDYQTGHGMAPLDFIEGKHRDAHPRRRHPEDRPIPILLQTLVAARPATGRCAIKIAVRPLNQFGSGPSADIVGIKDLKVLTTGHAAHPAQQQTAPESDSVQSNPWTRAVVFQ